MVLQLPLADVAVQAQSHFGLTGLATAIGEQPYKVCLPPPPIASGCRRHFLPDEIPASRRGLGVSCGGDPVFTGAAAY